MNITPEVFDAAKILWDYHHVHHQLHKADAILVLGSHDLRVADRGAELFLQGYSTLLIFSGGLGNFTQDMWDEKEADKFARIATNMGVPKESILIENMSTNTGENIQFTQRLLEENNLNPQSFVLVQKPYMERRSYATFRKNWPGKEVMITSPQINFEDYPTEDIPLERVIHIMVGDFQRIKEYPALGFQIEQPITPAAMQAYEYLLQQGFTKHLMKTAP